MKRVLRPLLASLLLFFCSTKAFPSEYFSSISPRPYSPLKYKNYQPLQFRGGITSGWKAPYGTGLDFSFLIYKIIDVNFGCGIGIGSAKIGLGTRLYPFRNPYFDPMIGVYLFDASGNDAMTVKISHWPVGGDEIAEYRIKPDKAVQINAGFRSRIENGIYINVGAGYTFPFKNEEAEYLSGSTSDKLRSRANIFRIGGVAINVGISFSLSKGD